MPNPQKDAPERVLTILVYLQSKN